MLSMRHTLLSSPEPLYHPYSQLKASVPVTGQNIARTSMPENEFAPGILPLNQWTQQRRPYLMQ